MRHGYLYEGLIPRGAFNEARAVWGDDWKPSRRSMSRALGTSGFGRFAPCEVPLQAGGTAWLYVLRTEDGLQSYAALLLPHYPAPFYFGREDALTGRTKELKVASGATISYPEKRQGSWATLRALPELTGCSSYPPENVFPWMLEKWKDGAATRGLDATITPTRKQYPLLRILQDTKQRVV